MNSVYKLISMSTLSLAVIGSASAEVRINGFANLVGGIAASDDTVYGFNDRANFSNQSLFAIQVSGNVNDSVSATAQIVSRGSEDFATSFEWAYLTYEASESTSVSMGRLRMPLFQYSASLDVGYSYHWVSAPQSVYNVPFNNIDGIRLDHNGYAGDWEYNFQLAVGNINNDFTLAGEAGNLNVDNVAVFTGELTYEYWKFRGVYALGKASFDIPALDTPFGQLSQLSPDLGNKLAAQDDSGVFYGGSIQYDAFSWFVAAEYTGIEIEQSFYPKESNFYVTAGIRSGKWTPFVTYEKSDLNNDPKFVADIANNPAQLQIPLTQLVVGIQQGVVSEDSTVSLGVRYDFDTNVALKADVTRVTNDINDEENSLLRFAVNYIF